MYSLLLYLNDFFIFVNCLIVMINRGKYCFKFQNHLENLDKYKLSLTEKNQNLFSLLFYKSDFRPS